MERAARESAVRPGAPRVDPGAMKVNKLDLNRLAREGLALVRDAPLLPTPALPGEVAHDPREPRLDGTVGERRMLEGRDPGLLHDVVRRRRIGEQALRELAHPPGLGKQVLGTRMGDGGHAAIPPRPARNRWWRFAES